MKALNDLDTYGFTHIDSVFTGKLLQKLRRKNLKRWEKLQASKIMRKHDWSLKRRTKFRGGTVMFLANGRYDVALDYGVFQSKEFVENEKIMKVVRAVFKTGHTHFSGSVPSLPRSDDGQWHQDTWPLFDDEKLEGSLPIYYLTVLVPLVDLTSRNGPTQVLVGSHKGEAHGRIKSLYGVKPLYGKAGSAIILDGRIHHRGLANLTSETRHMLYTVYCKKWYYEYHDETAEVGLTPRL
jgi:ectoine hydroxylase-related dioxygenase (phytanoyl-CoA dioxygenase family)